MSSHKQIHTVAFTTQEGTIFLTLVTLDCLKIVFPSLVVVSNSPRNAKYLHT